MQMGLRNGQSILLHYVVGQSQYQAVILLLDTIPPKQKKNEHRLWKYVIPNVSEFAWLPGPPAESFCGDALSQEYWRTYCSFALIDKDFHANVMVEVRNVCAWDVGSELMTHTAP